MTDSSAPIDPTKETTVAAGERMGVVIETTQISGPCVKSPDGRTVMVARGKSASGEDAYYIIVEHNDWSHMIAFTPAVFDTVIGLRAKIDKPWALDRGKKIVFSVHPGDTP